MSEYLSDVERSRAEALGVLQSTFEAELRRYHFRSGLPLDMLTALACEAVAEIYGRHRDDRRMAATMLRWIADNLERSDGGNGELNQSE